VKASIDWQWAPIFLVLGLMWWGLSFFSAHRLKPVVPFASLSFVNTYSSSLREKLAKVPHFLMIGTLICLMMAMLNPRLLLEKQQPENNSSLNAPPPVEGIAIYFVLDQSGSMSEKAQISRTGITKLELLKQTTKSFIEGSTQAGLEGRPNDMIGLIAFARTAQVLSPLTLDHASVLRELNKLDIMRIKDQDGTGIGYAIYKTANLIAATRHFASSLQGQGKPAYSIKDAVMILVTDGMQDPNPLDQNNRFRWMDPEQAADFAKKQNIRLYIVNIDPEFTKPAWEANRKQMQRMAETTGGHFYPLNAASDISAIYKEIDKLAPSTMPSYKNGDTSKINYAVWPLYPYLVLLGMVLFAMALTLQTTWLRTFP
jgi:Ca-activated chloride channel homolog